MPGKLKFDTDPRAPRPLLGVSGDAAAAAEARLRSLLPALLRQDGRLVRFGAGAGALAGRWRVSLDHAQGRRCPVLVLTPEPKGAALATRLRRLGGEAMCRLADELAAGRAGEDVEGFLRQGLGGALLLGQEEEAGAYTTALRLLGRG